MNPRKSPPPEASNEEVSALIATLHKTGQRFEELTAGGVDTVADRDGRSFLLRRAQNQLHHSAAAKQATILIVDDEIQSRQLLETLLKPEGYLTISAANAEEALASIAQRAPDLILLDIMMPGMDGCQVASILKANPATSNIPIIMVTVLIDRNARLAGLKAGVEEFVSKPVDRAELWLRVRNLLRLKAYGDFLQNHSLVLEQQVHARTGEVRASELRFRQMAENISDVFFLKEADSNRMLYISPAYEEIWGRSCERAYANPDAWTEAIHPDDRASTNEKFKNGMSAGKFEYEYRIVRPDGSIRWIEARGFPIRDNAGKLVRIAGVAKDITERKETDARILRLNRVYAVLSGINSAIVRIRERNELFREVCRISVSEGGFIVARVLELDSNGRVLIAATSESDSRLYQGLVDEYNGNPEHSQSLLALALRSGQPLISNDVADDPRIPNRAALTKGGNYALALLPIIVEKRVVGVIVLRAREAGMFNQDELHLLLELVSNLSFALELMDKRQEIAYLAYYDVLTGLANRALFHERLKQSVANASEKSRKLALVLLDIERFKIINDTLGRQAGDALLKDLAARLSGYAVDVGRVGRINADHFAVMVLEVQTEEELARRIEQRIGEIFGPPFRIGDSELKVSAKFGIAMFPADGADADTLFRNAEAALKNAKASGERYLFYTQTMNERVAEKLSLESKLRQALDKGEFVLHYQPKVNLDNGTVTSAEALIRWNDPRTGLVAPARFIPILEETGLILEVGRWALRKAIEDYLRWRAAGLPAVRIAVNVSPLQLRNRGFIAEIEQAIGIDAHAAAGLELEITESLIMQDIKGSIASLKAIRAMGVSVAIDDFGTGFSSLSYLSKLPVDTLKIDRSFVIDMVAGPDGLALVSTIINLAHSLKLKAVAEGVETEEQSRLLRLLKCDEMQGFLFSKPVPGETFETRFLAPPPAG